MDTSFKQKINKETLGLNNTLEQTDLIDIYKAFHPKAAEYPFSGAHGTLSRLDHMLGQKTSLNKFKKFEIILSIFSNNNGIKLEIKYGKKIVKTTKMWRLNNI